MSKKNKRYNHYHDIFDSNDKYLLDEYYEDFDFDYSEIIGKKNRKHNRHDQY